MLLKNKAGASPNKRKEENKEAALVSGFAVTNYAFYEGLDILEIRIHHKC